jgi:hypothetical protein
MSDKLVSEEVGQQLTFHTCLLQVLQNRTEALSGIPKAYVQDVKNKGNMFQTAIDKKLNEIYGPCNPEEIDQGMDLINHLADKLEEAWVYYKERAKQNKI